MKREKRTRLRNVVLDPEAVLYEHIRQLVIAARQTVARGVDLVQVWTNCEIGRHIVQHEQQGIKRAAYGRAVLRNLAAKLTREFGRGFSKSNLEYMRRFFLLYQARIPIAQSDTGQSGAVKASPKRGPKTAIAQFETGQLAAPAEMEHPFRLSWTHYVFLMGIQNADERSFYEIEAADQGWNLNELKRQFDSSLYERLALSRDKKGILCKQKHKTLVEITLPKGANIHAREYRLYLPGKEELRRKLIEWTTHRETADE